MSFITRAEARSQSLVYYFIGEECNKGHTADRLVSTDGCTECISERNENFIEDKGDKTVEKLIKKAEKLEFQKERNAEAEAYLSDPTHFVFKDEGQFEGLEFLPTSRKEAIATLSHYYYTSKPCSRGHLSKRLTSRGTCCVCTAAFSRKYRITSPEALRAARQNRRALKFAAGGKHSPQQLIDMLEQQGSKCKACECDLKVTGYHADHILPLILMGSNNIDNIQLLCPTCNLEKGKMHPDNWFAIVEKKRLNKLIKEGKYEPVCLL